MITGDGEIPKFVKTMHDVPFFVGLVANSWSKIELMLPALACKLMRVADLAVGKAVMFASSAVKRHDLLSTLLEIGSFSEQQREAVTAFLKEYEDVRVLRNDIVHGYWGMMSKRENPILVLTKSRKRLTETRDEKEITWLRDVYNQSESLFGKLVDVIQKFSETTIVER